MTVPEAYERLLLDAIRGDPDPLHPQGRSRGGWKIVDSILR